jgi:cell division transport system ATP-binding protein
VIQFQNVTKRYKDNDFAINDLNFVVNPGEFVFLIGPSGSGKTTVIKLLIREELPSNGRIFFDDFDITRLSRNSVYKLRRQLGVVFQDYKLIPDKTVYENVAFAMEVAGKTDKEIAETVPYLLDIVGLTHRARAFPDHLSGGEKQRVAIARAVSNNPRVLIADEPTGNLDPGAAWDIVQILSKINNWGTTVIMSTHGSDIVNTLNKRVIQMVNGKIIRDDSRGFYEQSVLNQKETDDEQSPEESAVENAVAESTNRKGPIKVSLKQQTTEVLVPRKLFGFIPWGKQKMPADDVEVEIAEPENLAVPDDNLSNLETTSDPLAEVLETPVAALPLTENIEADLEVAGYQTVEDIIIDGPETLAAKLNNNEEEAAQVAAAIEIAAAAANIDSASADDTAAVETSEAAPKKSKAKKVKVDLTGKTKSKSK